jgi:hypothetical protein
VILYLHASGLVDTGRTFGRHRGERDVRHIVVPEDTRVSDIAPMVLASFSSEEQSAPGHIIELLMINSHGSPGRLHLCGTSDEATDIFEGNASQFATPFRPWLRPLSEGGQGVEIHGCGICGGHLIPGTDEIDDAEIGFRFVYALACAFNIRVQASASAQVADDYGLFEDSLVVALPGDDGDLDWHGNLSSRTSNPLLVTFPNDTERFLYRVDATFGVPNGPRRRGTVGPRPGRLDWE